MKSAFEFDSGELSRRHAVLALVWALSVAYVWALLDRGWVPHDEGALAESAIRVLGGQLPHRDFDEIYTGGLSYLNALSFRLWGERLVSMRYMAFVAFAFWVPVVFYLALRFAPPLVAGLITLTAVAWSFPNYTAAMPSWYNLFLATGSLAALVHYVETPRVRWLVLAGTLAGLSCLIKIVGLYLAAGSLLFFVLYEQSSGGTAAGLPGPRWYGLMVIAGCVTLVGGLVAVVGERLGWREGVHFVLPGLAVAGCAMMRELRISSADPRVRLRRIGKLIVPYGIGLLAPLVLFLAFYGAHGAISDLVSGVFVKPFRRLAFAGQRPLPLGSMLPTFALASLLVGARGLSSRGRRVSAVALGVAFTTILLPTGVLAIGQLGWLSLSQAIPLTVIAALVLADRSAKYGKKDGPLLFALASILAISTLVQFPWTDPTYFAYLAPLEILTASAALSVYRPVPSELAAVMLSFYLAYPVAWVTPRLLATRGSRGLTHEAEIAPLLPGTADLRIRERRIEYERLVTLIRAHARGRYIYATPDSPEVYFLSGFRNPTRTFFEFFDEPAGRTPPVLEALASAGVTVVVLNSLPRFSGPVPQELAAALATEFPHDSTIGNFTVRWR
jgi:hypothetical protein